MRGLPGIALRIVAFAAVLAVARAAVPSPIPPDLRHALEMRKEMRLEDARKALVAWLEEHPDDGQMQFELAYTLAVQAMAESDAATATQLRKQAFETAKKAEQLGCTNLLLPKILSSINADGADLRDSRALSRIPEAAALILKGEQAFTRHELDEAFRCYNAAYGKDPQSYHAALFCGDVFFTQGRFEDALSWFAKAIAIDPDRETAHRYSGDAYVKLGNNARARAAYVDAVIAEPYNRIPREMLGRIARSLNIAIRTPDVAIPHVPIAVEGGKTRISFDPSAGPLVLAYTIARAHWLDTERSRYFPADSGPRHSVEEECAGLRMFVSTAEENSDSKETMEKFGPTVRTLKALDSAGLLAAYVLLDRADEGIAKDYDAYRRVNRGLLLRYVNEVWLGTPAAVAASKP